MACDWNLDTTDEPSEETNTLLCRCHTCGQYADLDCSRDYKTGKLVVSVMTCREKGGRIKTREVA